ncbi:flavin reductase family protein [Cellulomonas soli]|uniref:Reductase n=1 Tax=Cellulomonas soli TaxID=931535 RepID=A0A512PFU4_9CELL|nr:flavin reductase family protein [Cellulomonas soli]NYI59794.1 flavin reductase (DIM6/NTAB) family NADH-FMN oxidoreductase RutF [Cellulomonas soli]GEP70063.1 reductase [Cellulomonas soli]
MTEPAAVDPEAFRQAVGRLPAGIAVVTVRWRGHVHAMTASAVASVSLDPPLLLFCVHVDSRFREALDDVDLWAVSVLSDAGGPVADWLASPGRPTVDQLARVAHRPAPVSGAAWVDDASAWFDCRTEAVHRAGDHDVVVGRVLAAEQGPAGAGGLVHLRGRVHPVR